jgi:SHS2 domain-containing protein
MPFEEIRHTADWSIRIRAPDLSSLFIEAAHGMNAIAGIKLSQTPRIEHTFDADSSDYENHLVSFLSELVFYAECEQTAFDHFKITINENHMHIDMEGAHIQSVTKAIKAVTYHNLVIKETREGFEVVIVFDV